MRLTGSKTFVLQITARITTIRATTKYSTFVEARRPPPQPGPPLRNPFEATFPIRSRHRFNIRPLLFPSIWQLQPPPFSAASFLWARWSPRSPKRSPMVLLFWERSERQLYRLLGWMGSSPGDQIPSATPIPTLEALSQVYLISAYHIWLMLTLLQASAPLTTSTSPEASLPPMEWIKALFSSMGHFLVRWSKLIGVIPSPWKCATTFMALKKALRCIGTASCRSWPPGSTVSQPFSNAPLRLEHASPTHSSRIFTARRGTTLTTAPSMLAVLLDLWLFTVPRKFSTTTTLDQLCSAMHITRSTSRLLSKSWESTKVLRSLTTTWSTGKWTTTAL